MRLRLGFAARAELIQHVLLGAFGDLRIPRREIRLWQGHPEAWVLGRVIPGIAHALRFTALARVQAFFALCLGVLQ